MDTLDKLDALRDLRELKAYDNLLEDLSNLSKNPKLERLMVQNNLDNGKVVQIMQSAANPIWKESIQKNQGLDLMAKKQ